jgi:Domain of unknown function (DUF4062)
MARPRVFVSSTYYDLKHLRSSLEAFIERLGYEPVLSEKDRIAYLPDLPLDESCYREARSSDVFVLIIGGRYGSEASGAQERPMKKSKEFYERYDSITKTEFLNAGSKGIPTFICIEASVDAEYHTFLKNKTSTDIVYAHVDSVNIFELIEFIRSQQKNNPIKLFTRYSEIEDWLREQWAGFFKELIGRMSQQREIDDLSKKIYELSETTETLKRYLEQIIGKVTKEKTETDELIRQENERLRAALEESEFLSNGFMRHLKNAHNIPVSKLRTAVETAESLPQFADILFGNKKKPECMGGSRAFSELNAARERAERKPFLPEEHEHFKRMTELGNKAVKTTEAAAPKSKRPNSEAPGQS